MRTWYLLYLMAFVCAALLLFQSEPDTHKNLWRPKGPSYCHPEKRNDWIGFRCIYDNPIFGHMDYWTPYNTP